MKVVEAIKIIIPFLFVLPGIFGWNNSIYCRHGTCSNNAFICRLDASSSSGRNYNSRVGCKSKGKNDDSDSFNTKSNRLDDKRSKIELSWCNEIECMYAKREQVLGPDNAITFASPATGQVMYSWLDFKKEERMKADQRTILFLVKRDDDELMVDASKAVKKLTEELGIRVLLQPEYAAKLKHYYGVDNELINLFEVKKFLLNF